MNKQSFLILAFASSSLTQALQAAFLTLNYLPFDEADLEPPAEK